MGFNTLILVHSYLRWIILILIAFVLVSSFIGWFKNHKRVSRYDERQSFWMTLSVDVMFFIGLILWIFGDKGYNLITTFGMSTVMKTSAMRFNVVEHPLSMLVALVLLHIGKSKLDKSYKFQKEGNKGYKLLFIYTLLAVLVIFSSIPWPWRDIIGRPLFPV